MKLNKIRNKVDNALAYPSLGLLLAVVFFLISMYLFLSELYFYAFTATVIASIVISYQSRIEISHMKIKKMIEEDKPINNLG